jgi:hypothetical protein
MSPIRMIRTNDKNEHNRRVPAIRHCVNLILEAMRLRGRLAAAVGLSICIVLVDVSWSAAQTDALEYQLKATYLYNFAKFVEWPRAAFASPADPFKICVIGDPFNGALERTVQDEMLGGRPFVVRQIPAVDQVRGCHILYMGPAEARRSPDVIAAAMNAPILTVGDTEDFINQGGMIRFVRAGHRIRFEINPAAAERAGLKVSSRLLRLAEIVQPPARGN